MNELPLDEVGTEHIRGAAPASEKELATVRDAYYDLVRAGRAFGCDKHQVLHVWEADSVRCVCGLKS